MNQFLTANTGTYTDTLWETLNTLSAKAEHKKVAVAYLGNTDVFRWNKGDELVVALTEDHVRSKAVSPHKLLELYNRGVKLYKWPSLHAKIFYFGTAAVVGSMNLSYHAQEELLEAGLLVEEAVALETVKQFLDRFFVPANAINLEELLSLQNLYGVEKSALPEKTDTTSGRLWLLNTVTLPPDQLPLEEAVASICNLKAFDPFSDLFVYKTFYYALQHNPHFHIKSGDQIIDLYKNETIYLSPPLHCVKVEIRDGWRLLHVKYSTRRTYKPWEPLRQWLQPLQVDYGEEKELTYRQEEVVRTVDELCKHS